MTDSNASAKALDPAKRGRLIEIIGSRSFQAGAEIKLASGRSSNFYFNMKPTMMHPEGAALIASLILDAIDANRTDLIGGLEMGAVPLASAVCAISHNENRPLSAFFVRKAAKGHGTKARIEGLGPGETMTGRGVVIVEDVTTTGGSALQAVDVVRAAGATVVQVVTVVDRLEGASAAFSAADIVFTALVTADDFKN